MELFDYKNKLRIEIEEKEKSITQHKEEKKRIENRTLSKKEEAEIRRSLIIRKLRELREREPTEEEIQEWSDSIDRIKKKLIEREPIPIIGPYEDKIKENKTEDGFIKV